MAKPGRKISTGTITAVVAILTASALILSHDLWSPLERKAYDLRVRASVYFGIGQTRATGKTVVVEIDEAALFKEKPQIFWYPDIGRFILLMKEYGATTVAIDIIPVHSLGEEIRHAAQAAVGSDMKQQYGEFLDVLGERLDNALLGAILETSNSASIILATTGDAVPYFYGELSSMTNVLPANARLTKDKDLVLRSQKLSAPVTGDFLPYAVYRTLAGRPQTGSAAINYALAKSLPRYMFQDVMSGLKKKEDFAGKAVLLGIKGKYADLHLTPLGMQIPGVELNGLIIETLLTGTGARHAGWGFEAAALLLLTIAGWGASAKLRPTRAMLAILAATFFYSLLNFVLFSRGFVIALFPYLLSPFLIFSFVYPYRYVAEEMSRKKIYKVFGYYIDKRVIDSLVEKDRDGILKGERTAICILFLDIRNFTPLFRENEAENIIQLLNHYFRGVTQAIQGCGGFVNKFMGDGVLAFFSSGSDSVDSAIRASRKIVEETSRINETGLVSSLVRGWELRIGIGIHYGEVVMGNVGSEDKMDFTIIGDPVNIASRIQDLSKELHRTVLLSGDAYKMTRETPESEYLGKFRVKGSEKEIDIYTV